MKKVRKVRDPRRAAFRRYWRSQAGIKSRGVSDEEWNADFAARFKAKMAGGSFSDDPPACEHWSLDPVGRCLSCGRKVEAC